MCVFLLWGICNLYNIGFIEKNIYKYYYRVYICDQRNDCDKKSLFRKVDDYLINDLDWIFI